VRKIKKRGLLLSVQLLCSALFLTAGGAAIGIKSGEAVIASLSELKATEGAAEREPTAPPEESAPDRSPAEEPTDPPEGTPIVQVELSLSEGTGDILFKNETAYTFDPEAMLNSGYPIEPASSEPSVLIIHSHATECYTEEGADLVTATRSEDPSKNMIAVGSVMAEAFEEAGIGVIHCTVMHDSPSYSEAYVRSKETVKEYLQKYPGIKYIIDVHRDAITTPAGEMAKPVITKDGTALAQLMLVVGTDEAGAEHPGWKTNLCVAIRTQAELLKASEELMRPINLRSASFNQQLCEGYLLLEVGSCANTLAEAKASARIFVNNFAAMIKNP